MSTIAKLGTAFATTNIYWTESKEAHHCILFLLSLPTSANFCSKRSEYSESGWRNSESLCFSSHPLDYTTYQKVYVKAVQNGIEIQNVHLYSHLRSIEDSR